MENDKTPIISEDELSKQHDLKTPQDPEIPAPIVSEGGPVAAVVTSGSSKGDSDDNKVEVHTSSTDSPKPKTSVESSDQDYSKKQGGGEKRKKRVSMSREDSKERTRVYSTASASWAWSVTETDQEKETDSVHTSDERRMPTSESNPAEEDNDGNPVSRRSLQLHCSRRLSKCTCCVHMLRFINFVNLLTAALLFKQHFSDWLLIALFSTCGFNGLCNIIVTTFYVWMFGNKLPFMKFYKRLRIFAIILNFLIIPSVGVITLAALLMRNELRSGIGAFRWQISLSLCIGVLLEIIIQVLIGYRVAGTIFMLKPHHRSGALEYMSEPQPEGAAGSLASTSQGDSAASTSDSRKRLTKRRKSERKSVSIQADPIRQQDSNPNFLLRTPPKTFLDLKNNLFWFLLRVHLVTNLILKLTAVGQLSVSTILLQTDLTENFTGIPFENQTYGYAHSPPIETALTAVALVTSAYVFACCLIPLYSYRMRKTSRYFYATMIHAYIKVGCQSLLLVLISYPIASELLFDADWRKNDKFTLRLPLYIALGLTAAFAIMLLIVAIPVKRRLSSLLDAYSRVRRAYISSLQDNPVSMESVESETLASSYIII